MLRVCSERRELWLFMRSCHNSRSDFEKHMAIPVFGIPTLSDLLEGLRRCDLDTGNAVHLGEDMFASPCHDTVTAQSTRAAKDMQ